MVFDLRVQLIRPWIRLFCFCGWRNLQCNDDLTTQRFLISLKFGPQSSQIRIKFQSILTVCIKHFFHEVEDEEYSEKQFKPHIPLQTCVVHFPLNVGRIFLNDEP